MSQPQEVEDKLSLLSKDEEKKPTVVQYLIKKKNVHVPISVSTLPFKWKIMMHEYNLKIFT